MENHLYEHKLPNHKIFKDVKDGLSENASGKLRNLLTLKDDVLYLWSPNDNCLFTLNIKQLEENGEETPYQKLHFMSAPAYTVERLLTSECGSRICAWGSRGVTIAELPSRWGRGGLFDSGNQTVLCKSYTLDERFLYSQGEVRSVQWHPTSLSHVLVLTSDNSLRLYNIALKKGPKLVKTFCIGPKPTTLLAGKTLLDSLGDTAVDFTAIPDTHTLLILRGNGDVYMMDVEVDNKSSVAPQLSGPLAMYPPADDNYGSESCCIAALGGADTPTLVVIATCSAALYHCLLLPNPPDSSDTHSLYVLEAVELNITLNPNDDMQYSYPVHIYPCNNSTYACAHAGGVHIVSVPVVNSLTDLALADDTETESWVSSVSTTRSSARHALSTAPAPAAVALTAAPLCTLLLLCADGTLVPRALTPFDLEDQLYKELQLKNPALEQDDINNILKERQKLSFTSIIQEILSRDVSQPILNSGKRDVEPSPKECLELLSQATLKLRGEYVLRQQRASDAVSRKLHALATLSAQHGDWLASLQTDMDDAQLQSAVLREKCLLAEKHQDDLKYRCSAVVRNLRATSSTSPAERDLLAELERYKRTSDQIHGQIQSLKQHARVKSTEWQKWHDEYEKKAIALGKSHSDTISSILQQQTSQISSLIEETKLLKDQLNIV